MQQAVMGVIYGHDKFAKMDVTLPQLQSDVVTA